MMGKYRPLLVGLALSIGLIGTLDAGADPTPKGWSFREMGAIPVQAGGRIKPFDSYARDLVLQITGRRTFEGWDPVELVLSWLADPKGWDSKQFILITRKDVKRQLGLDEDRNRFSPKELLIDSFLAEYANSMGGSRGGMSAQSAPIGRTSKPDPRDEELKRLFERVSVYRAIVSGEAWPVIPAPAPAAWGTLALGEHHGESVEKALATMPGRPVREAYVGLFTGFMNGAQDRFDAGVAAVSSAVKAEMKGEWDESLSKKISAELLYNRMHPYQLAWIAYLIAALLWAISIWLSAAGVAQVQTTAVGLGKKVSRVALPVTFLGIGLHVFGMGLRCYIAGRPPVTNMYESIVWVSFGVLLFATVLWFIQKNQILFAVATALSAIGLIVSDAAPAMIDPSINPLVPVLRSNYWLLIHVLTITLSYAAFALTLGIGNVTLWFFWKGEEHTQEGAKKIATLNQLTYRAMQFGVVLVAAGTILGGIWADYSWGRFWGWDPKEVWALIVLLGYIAVLHARYAGWMRPFSFAAWTVIAFTLVMMAWYGVNFVLGVGLHSYGFSTGGQSTVAIFVALQLAYVVGVALKRKRAGASRGDSPVKKAS
ncbi:MAG: cytochrome c biogenesis protein CcsA [Bdellovibrionales bacterium]|nr:cytochrome c biogenesis protein CcsA [Bdellovibrionales bacterium]